MVLFLCAANSARSQLAEALLRAKGGDRFEAASAGLSPKGVHPLTVRVLEEIGLNTAGMRSKSSTEFLGKASVRFAIIVCECDAAECPRIFPFAGQTLSWPFDDPATATGKEEERLAVFRRVRDQISQRIDAWLAEPERAR